MSEQDRVSLEDQLALALDSMMSTQEALTLEREAWANERAQFMHEMEQERGELAKVRVGLEQSVLSGAERAVQSVVLTAASNLSRSVGSELQAQVGKKIADAESSLVIAAGQGINAADRLQKLSQDLKGNWKASLQRTAWQTLPALGIFLFVSWLIVLFAQRGVYEAQLKSNKAYDEMKGWEGTIFSMRADYRKMKAEVEKWRAAGISHVELLPCAGGGGLCVLVDKSQGAFGEKKNLYVPGSTGSFKLFTIDD